MRSGDHKKVYGTFVYNLDEHTVEEIENVARSVLYHILDNFWACIHTSYLHRSHPSFFHASIGSL
jgi:hypothetical protein